MTGSDIDADLNTIEEEGLLTRWSRRKHEARAPRVDQKTQKKIEEKQPATLVQDESDEPQELLPEDSDMPALETLNEDSDYSGFMSSKVSDSLRTLALRQLFRGSMFNVRDGLDDYDDDFTQFAKLGDVVTAEMRRQIERLKEAEGEGLGEEIIDEEVSDEKVSDQKTDSETDSAGLSTAEASEAAGNAGAGDEHEVTLGQLEIEDLEITAKKDSGE